MTSDDDFQTAPPPRNSTSPPGAAGDAAAGSASQAPPAMQAPAAAAQAGKSWKALPKEVQQQVFIFFKERLGVSSIWRGCGDGAAVVRVVKPHAHSWLLHLPICTHSPC